MTAPQRESRSVFAETSEEFLEVKRRNAQLRAKGPQTPAEALLAAADALEKQPPQLRAQYVATLRLYANEPWRLDSASAE